MKPSQFFTLIAICYLAPYLPTPIAIAAGVVFLILAGVMLAIKQ